MLLLSQKYSRGASLQGVRLLQLLPRKIHQCPPIPCATPGGTTKTPSHSRFFRPLPPQQQQHQQQRYYASTSIPLPPQVLLERHVPFKDKDDTTNGTLNIPDSKHVSILTLNRPKAANAMGTIMLRQLKGCLIELESYECDIRCVILTSCSDQVFSAGADLKERATMTIQQACDFVTDLRLTFDRFSQLPMPVIASVEGVAVGGGLELCLAAADFIVASETAVLGLPETSLAIVPGAGGTQRLSRWIGRARAKELIYTGSRIDGVTAERYGLVQHVVKPGQAMTRALELAHAIAANGPVAIRAAKFAIDEGLAAKDMTAALAIELQAYERVLATRDRLEGLNAFREKRKPEYRGN